MQAHSKPIRSRAAGRPGHDDLVTDDSARWNHNVHYHRLVLDSVPAGARDVLDVGCGEGMLARRLRRTVPNVVAIDLDRASIDLAEAQSPGTDIDYRHGDFVTHPFPRESFDMIVSIATVHHMAAHTALARMKDLLRPGGTLAIVGLARGRPPADLPMELAGVVANWVHRLTKTEWDHPSPTVWPPPETYTAMRRLAVRLLPGARYRRHLLWRYSIIWTKPPREGSPSRRIAP